MKHLLLGIIGLVIISACNDGSKNNTSGNLCGYDKDSMIVVMRFERKVKPENVAFFKHAFDACKAEVLAKEPGCLDYSLFQSYNDSTIFCLTETWANKGVHNAHMELEHTKKLLSEISNIDDPSYKSTTSYVYWICPGANQQK